MFLKRKTMTFTGNSWDNHIRQFREALQKVRKNTVKRQSADGLHVSSIRKYEERRCA